MPTLITNDELYALQTTALEPLKEAPPAGLVLLIRCKWQMEKGILFTISFKEYDIQSTEDMQGSLIGGIIKEMMEIELYEHLGYEKSERSGTDDCCNGYKSKCINSSYGRMDIQDPQDRKSTFEPQVVRKHPKDIPGIDQKIIYMYSKGNSSG